MVSLKTKQRFKSYVEVNPDSTDFVYTALIDSAAILLNLDSWSSWATVAGLSFFHRWPENLMEDIVLFERKVRVAIWPSGENRIGSLESAIKNLASVSLDALDLLCQHFESDGDGLNKAHKFYKEPFPNPVYKEEFLEYDVWENQLRDKFVEFCRAANYFADEVRASINPMFFLENGRFMFENQVYEYSSDDKEVKKEILNVVGYSSNVDWLDEKSFDAETVRAMVQALSAKDANKMFLRVREKGVAMPEVLICGVDVVFIKDRATLHNLIVQLMEVEERLIKMEKRLEGTKARGGPLVKKKGEFIVNRTITKKEG